MSEYRDFEPKPVIPKIPKDDPEPIINEPEPVVPIEPSPPRKPDGPKLRKMKLIREPTPKPKP